MATLEPRSTVDIRDANTAVVGRLLREHGELSRSDLASLSGLARPTVSSALERLIRDGLVGDGRRVRNDPRGRPTTLLRFRTESRSIAVLRFRNRTVEATMTDLSGSTLASVTAARPANSSTPAQIVDAFAALVPRLLAEHPDAPPLVAACLSLPGAVDRERGLWTSPTNPQWRRIPLINEIADRVGVPVTAINVVAAALRGQLARDDVHPAGGAALVYLGRGLGSAVAGHDVIVDGATGSAGELGHCTVPGSTIRCRCGRRGCVEASCAMHYLRRRYRELTGDIPPATIAEMERSPRTDVRAVLDDAAKLYGWAAALVANIVNPATLYLGGGPITDGADRFLAVARASLLANTHRAVRDDLQVVHARRGAVLVGASTAASDLLPTWLRPSARVAG